MAALRLHHGVAIDGRHETRAQSDDKGRRLDAQFVGSLARASIKLRGEMSGMQAPFGSTITGTSPAPITPHASSTDSTRRPRNSSTVVSPE
jgi:hypothetical protein